MIKNESILEIWPLHSNSVPYNMRPVFTADQKGTLDFAGRQLWMSEIFWKFWKNFGKGGSEGIGFLNGLV